MESGFLIELLTSINKTVKENHSFEENFEASLIELKEKCEFNTRISINLKLITHSFSPHQTIEWDYIVFCLHVLQEITRLLDKSQDHVLSVQQSKTLKLHLKTLVDIGICSKLLPNVPLYQKNAPLYDNGDIFYNYNILKTTTLELIELLKCPSLRLLIIPENLGALLVASYQIAYCPLKKPSTNSNGNQKNVITEQIYKTLCVEKEKFIDILYELQETIHPGIFVKETMAILHSNAPPWFKKTVSQHLTLILKRKNGIESIATTLLDGAADIWKILDVMTKLILNCKTFPDFKYNICNQLVTLLLKVREDTVIYERLYTHCTKSLYKSDPELAKDVLIRPVVSFFVFFTYKSHRFKDDEEITEKLKQSIRITHTLFVENEVELKVLPIELLTPVADVLFKFFISTALETNFKVPHKELGALLISFLACSNSNNYFQIFDCFLFNFSSNVILSMRNDLIITVAEKTVKITYANYSVGYSISNASAALLELLKFKTDMKIKLFNYLLNCLVEKEKYLKKEASEELLLPFENDFMNTHYEKNLAVYRLLSQLAEDENIHTMITKEPDEVVKYIKNVLLKSIELKTYQRFDSDSEEFQAFFTVLMILQHLAHNCSKNTVDKYKSLVDCLREIQEDSCDAESQNLIREILEILNEGKAKAKRMLIEDIQSAFDKAIEDICDPLLPIRGHGLMTLSKLVEQKNANVMERKQYVLNIFQQNLKNEDSYIYLNAISGLAALADVFPDTVLNTLCEEFSDTMKKYNDDGHEVRIKLGESLVRVTKLLGEMAPKYKPLLLNTFLNGVKDEDDLIRASSLSNLGEICKVLGYKLGAIFTEVLVCVHAVITTDKSPQARRSAVAVIRQLFVGLKSEMITFLKDDILPIYRTLKEIYYNDKDDVMRLQAQLALEELNENMKNFVLPNPQLHTEKKIVMLD